jgi:hypothetical protein
VEILPRRNASMLGFIDVMIKIIPLIAAILAIVRFMISTINKSIIEIILTPNNKKYWEDFYELIVISLIVTAGIFVPGFIKPPFSDRVSEVFILIVFTLIVVTGVSVLIFWILSWFKNISRKKMFEYSVLGNLLAVIIFMTLIFSALHKEIIEYEISELMIMYILCALFVCILFHVYRSIYKTLNKSKKNIYQIEPISSSLMDEELKSLKFEFMLDDERHVLSKSSTRSHLDFPIFIFYPKEYKLIKYIKYDK